MEKKLVNLDDIRNICLIITSIATIISVIIKIAKDIFIESIKSKYRNYPGNQSIISILSKAILYIIIALDVVGVIFVILIPAISSFYKFITEKNLDKVEKIVNNSLVNIIPISIVFTVFILCVIQVLGTIYLFSRIREKYIEKLEKKEITRITLKRIKKYRKYIFIIIGLAEIYLIIFSGFIYTNYLELSVEQIIWLSTFWISNLFILIVLINLTEMCKVLQEKNIFKITPKDLKDAEIEFNDYLEYKDYYMIFQNGEELYINRSEVKRINKVLNKSIEKENNEIKQPSEREVEDIEIKNSLRNKNKFLFNGIIFMISIIIVSVALMLLFKNSYYGSELKIEHYFNFVSSFGGAILVSMTSVIVLVVTVKQTRDIQNKIIKREEEENINIIKSSAFIIYNDLKEIFKDISEMLIIYSVYNGSPIKEKEERVELILSWKQIGRGYVYYKDWRDTLRILSAKLDRNTVENIYEIYTVLERSMKYHNDFEENNLSYDELFRKIEYIPREYIFNLDFLDKYSSLKWSISEYDNFRINVYKQNDDQSSKDDINWISEIYKKRSYFIELQNEAEKDRQWLYSDKNDLLDEKWTSILENLNHILLTNN